MIRRNEHPVVSRAHRSDLDRRAIDVAGHLLLGVVWLESRIASVPDRLGALVEMAGRSGATGPIRVPALAVTGNQPWHGSRTPVQPW
jgi:hypothetical protein